MAATLLLCFTVIWSADAAAESTVDTPPELARWLHGRYGLRIMQQRRRATLAA